jgi:hypothetical protein
MPASKGADRGRAIHGFGPDFKALAPGCGGMAGAARRETGVTTKTLWHQGGFRRRRRKLRFFVPSCLGGSRNPPSLPGSCSPWPPSDAFRNIHRAREGGGTTKTPRHQGDFGAAGVTCAPSCLSVLVVPGILPASPAPVPLGRLPTPSEISIVPAKAGSPPRHEGTKGDFGAAGATCAPSCLRVLVVPGILPASPAPGCVLLGNIPLTAPVIEHILNN